MADAENAKKISFFHGSETKLNDSITAGTIGTNSVVISTEDNMIYVDDSKVPHTLGNAKSKEAHTVQLGVGGSVGGIKTGDIIEAGTDLDALIKKIIMKRVPATYIAPKISLAVSKGAQPGNYEVGTTLTATMTANFTKQDAGALTEAKAYADTKKTEAVDAAAADATTKANNALASAKEYANGLIEWGTL